MCRETGSPGGAFHAFGSPRTPKGHTQDPFATNPVRADGIPIQEEIQMLRVEIEYCAV